MPPKLRLAANVLCVDPTTGVLQPAAKAGRGGGNTLTGDEGDQMKKTFSGILVAALAFAGVVGTSAKADAALVIDFDNIVFDAGTITGTAGGNFSGSGISFDSIYLKDTTAGTTLAGAQCGVATSVGAAT